MSGGTCITCRGAKVVTRPPMNHPEACPTCCGPQISALAATAAPDEFVTFPMMKATTVGVLVKKPDADVIPMGPFPHGAVAVGPDHIPGVGPVICIAIQQPTGETVVAILGQGGFGSFGADMNAAARRIMAGEFDMPRPLGSA